MKVFAFIFSLYFLALALMPCHDREDFHMDKSQVSKICSSSTTNDNENTSETCSPFCVCACCGQAFSIDLFYSYTPFTGITSSKGFPVYTSAFISEVFFNIWQPPKIS